MRAVFPDRAIEISTFSSLASKPGKAAHWQKETAVGRGVELTLLGHASCCRAGLLVVAPEAQHLHDPLLLQHLVDEAVLDVDAP